jgi:NAD(P)-dependent dehydrogenase (short-subunit alcohol dehydrogenase family)
VDVPKKDHWSVTMLLANKVAFVSGIGPGMGRDVAVLFAEHGADVVLGARSAATVDEVKVAVENHGRKALGVPLNIADPDACRAAVDEAISVFGRIDVLVNNAFHSGDFNTFVDADLTKWQSTMNVNFFGTLKLTQLVVPAMKEQGDGRIVMINSIAPLRVEPGSGAYSASKSALATATKTLARELGPWGIRVNGVHPGHIWSAKLEQHLRATANAEGISYERKLSQVKAETCLGYLPDSAEIAGSVLFFASDLSKPVTGQALGVNAGQYFQGF